MGVRGTAFLFLIVLAIHVVSSTAEAQINRPSGVTVRQNVGEIFIRVAPDGETTVRCSGIECETDNCSGFQQIVTADPLTIRRQGGICTTTVATTDEASALDAALQETFDILLAAAGPTEPTPGAGPPPLSNPGSQILPTSESPEAEVTDTGESPSTEASPNTLQ